jgi:uncharacterized protein with GYD domain
MSLFLAQAAYTGESWKMQLENQQNVQQRIDPLVKELGGHIVGAFYAFGEYDIVLLMEMPSEEAAAAFALAVSAGGAVSALKTTPLLTIEQGMDAMKRAADAAGTYRAPIPQPAPV